MSTSTIDAAIVANTLLDFSRDNQQTLLEVMTDYFTSCDVDRHDIEPFDGNSSQNDAIFPQCLYHIYWIASQCLSSYCCTNIMLHV